MSLTVALASVTHESSALTQLTLHTFVSLALHMCVFVCELSFRVRNYNCNRSLLLQFHFRYNFRASVVIYL